MDMHVDWGALLKLVAVVAVIALILAALVLALAFRTLRRVRLRVPPNADFFTTVRAVPLSLVVGLDLLDLGLDVFSAPIIWFILNRFGLQALRNVATVEALIPITGPIPTMTLGWLAARIFKLGEPHDPDLIETRRIGPDSYVPRPRGWRACGYVGDEDLRHRQSERRKRGGDRRRWRGCRRLAARRGACASPARRAMPGCSPARPSGPAPG